MKIFNFFKNEQSIVGLKPFKQEENDEIKNPTIYTGDYSSMFRFNLDKTISPKVGQNLYYLS